MQGIRERLPHGMVSSADRNGWARWAMIVMILVYALVAAIPVHAHGHGDSCGGHAGIQLSLDNAAAPGSDEPPSPPLVPGHCCLVHAGAILPPMAEIAAKLFVWHVAPLVLRDDQIADFGAHQRLERPPRALRSI